MSEDWRRGYPLEELVALARPFKTMHKPLVFGAFGLVKERDVAEAMSRGCFFYVGDGETAGAALFKELTRTSSLPTDFTGDEIPLFSGKRLYVSALAATSALMADDLLLKLGARGGSDAMYVEIFEEDRIARAALGRAHYSYLATKISAGGEVKGVYAAPWTFPDDHQYAVEDEATLVVLRPEFISPEEREAILGEIYNESRWQQHYSSYNKRKSWTSFALRGYQDDPGFIIKPAEMSKAWREGNPLLLDAKPRDTEIAHLFPRTMEVVRRLGLALDRVRFMRLSGKNGELTRHADITDREAGTANGKISRLHVPVKTQPGVEFVGWSHRGERIATHLPERSLCYLDQRKPHAVTNSSGEERVHLVVDVLCNQWLRDQIVSTFLKEKTWAPETRKPSSGTT